jgi:hypothetical protein
VAVPDRAAPNKEGGRNLEPRWLILVCSVVTHALLILVLIPRYWDPFRRSGWTWPDLVVPVFMPLSFTTVLVAQLFDHWQALPEPVRIVGSLGVGAATATVIIALSRLRSLGA